MNLPGRRDAALFRALSRQGLGLARTTICPPLQAWDDTIPYEHGLSLARGVAGGSISEAGAIARGRGPVSEKDAPASRDPDGTVICARAHGDC